MRIFKRTPGCPLTPWIVGGLALGVILLSQTARASDDLTDKAQAAGDALSKSVEKGIHKTGDYLKSDSFHQKMHQITTRAGEAITNAGNWVGRELDKIKDSGSAKK
jgi:hypothetical protein